MSASIASRCAAGSVAIFPTMSPKPFFTSTPSLASVAACLSKTGLKKTCTACPKMIGSETFIIVAFKCKEKSRFSARAASTCAVKNAMSAFLLRKVPSRISPSRSFSPSFRTVTAPSAATCSIRTLVALPIVTDFSLPKKSPLLILATVVLLSLVHAPILCGFSFAYAFTALGARRSELPSRMTGLTALPLILS